MAVRPTDRFCGRCGTDVGRVDERPLNTEPFSPHRGPIASAGDFLVVHAKGALVLLVVAIIAVLVAITPTDTATTDEPSSAEVTSVVDDISASADADAPTEPAEETVTASSSTGKTYSCPTYALSEIDDADTASRASRKRLRGMESALKALDAKYPDGTAPAPAADRYNALLARYKTQIKTDRAAVRKYNRLLRNRCDLE